MERLRIINYRGKSIIRSDFSHLNVHHKEEIKAHIAHVMAEIARRPPGSVLILTDLTGLRFDMDIIRKFISFTLHNKPYIKASAVIGIAGLQQTVLYSVLQYTLRMIHSFDSETQALDWLAEQ